MFRLFLFSLRPPAIALAIFIAFNLFLALGPGAAATRVWLYLQLPEPGLSLFASLLGLALVVPHAWAKHAGVRWFLGGVIFAFCLLVGSNVLAYYHRLSEGRFTTDFPLPFSLFILAILACEFVRVSWWAPATRRLPRAAWTLSRAVLVTLSFFGLILLHIMTFGHTDYRRAADVAVILGAKVYDDGSLSPALEQRVDTGVELFRQGLVSHLIMSGGRGPNGQSEPEAMAYHAQDRGVPLPQILLDPNGFTTRDTARNCGELARRRGFEKILAVSQDFHCARVKLIFEREGTRCFTVPARGPGGRPRPFLRPSFSLFREVVAYPFYLLRHS